MAVQWARLPPWIRAQITAPIAALLAALIAALTVLAWAMRAAGNVEKAAVAATALAALSAGVWSVRRKRGQARSHAVSPRAEPEPELRSILENIPGLVYAHKVYSDGRREAKYTSPELRALLEADPGLSLTGDFPETILPLVHPDDRKRYEAAMQEARETQKAFDLEYRLLRSDGTARWFHSIATPTTEPDGVLWHGLMLDVTQMRPAVDADASARMLESIRQVHIGCIRSRDLGANCGDTLEMLLGSTRSECGFIAETVVDEAGAIVLRGLAITDQARDGTTGGGRCFPFEREISGELVCRNMDSLCGCVLETRSEVISNEPGTDPRGDGSASLRSFLGLPLFHGDEIVGVVGLGNRNGGYSTAIGSAIGPLVSTCATILEAHRDDENRGAAERALRASELRHREILSLIPDAIILTDGASRVVECNPPALALAGLAKEGTIGRSIRQVFPGPLAEATQGLLDRVQAFGGPEFADVASVNVRGERDVRECRVVVVGRGGALIVVRDVTQKRMAEENEQRLAEQLRHAQKLESLGVLAGGIAHDFNNLLMGVLGNADLASGHTPADSPAAPLLADIVTAATYGTHLTRQLLAYAGKREVRPTVVDLRDLVGDANPLMRATLRRSGNLAVSLGDTPLPVFADRTQIEQYLVNLIGNASDSLPETGGELSVVCSLRTLGAAETSLLQGSPLAQGDYASIEIADNGAGMTPDVRAKMFDPFFSTKFPGRGLGLGVVMGIVKAHGAGMLVRTSPGEGTSITALFPLVRSDREGGVAEPVLTRPSFRLRMRAGAALVVDDEPMVRRITTRLLEAGGWTVHSADSGDAAIALMRQHGDSIVAALVDLTMPGMNGVETTRALRQIKPDVQVVLSSGFAPDADSILAADPSLRFIAKPFTGAELLAALDGTMHVQGRGGVPAV